MNTRYFLSITGQTTGRKSDGVIRLYICTNCGRVRKHGKWIYLTKEQEIDLAKQNVEWIRKNECLGCYQLVNNSKNEKEGKL